LGANSLPQDASGNGRHFIKAMADYTYTTMDSAGGPLGDTGFISTAALGFGQMGLTGFYENGLKPPPDNVGIEVWVKPVGLGWVRHANPYVFSTGNLGSMNLSVDSQNGMPVFRAGIGYSAWVGDPVPFDTNKWTHLAVVRDRGLATFYVDGVAHGASSTVIPIPNGSVHLGVREGGMCGFKGLLDEARIFTFAPGQFTTNDLLLRSTAEHTDAHIVLESTLTPRFLVDVWQNDRGLPQNTVNAIAQTSDGYLWVGTLGGLARFDGLNFTVFNPANTPALGSARIRALCAGRRGTLWITTLEGGLVRQVGGRFSAVRLPPSEGAHPVLQNVIEDESGVLWMTASDGTVGRLEKEQYSVVSSNWASVASAPFRVHENEGGSPWVTTRDGLYKMAGSGLAPVFEDQSGQVENFLGPSRSGGYWVSRGGKALLWKDGRWETAVGRPSWITTAAGLSFGVEDHQGNLWLGSAGRGVFRYSRDGLALPFSTGQGMGSDYILTLFEDAEGNMWVGTDGGGLCRLRQALFISYGRAKGLSSDRVTTVCQGPKGELWVGTESDGVTQMQPGDEPLVTRVSEDRPTRVAALQKDHRDRIWMGSRTAGASVFSAGRFARIGGFPNADQPVSCLFEDSSKRMWLGQSHSRKLVAMKDESAIVLDVPLSMPALDVRVVAEDADKTLWFGTDGAGLLSWRNEQWTRFTRSEGLGSDIIWSLYADPDGALWIGTFGGGLSRLKAGKIVTCTTRQGLEDDVICHIADDERGFFWFSSHRGVFRVSKKELDEFADGTRRGVQCISYGKSDGLPTLECAGGCQPAGCRTSDGRLWFPTLKGLVVVNPADIPLNLVWPQVHIDKMLVDGEIQDITGAEAVTKSNLDSTATLRIPPGRLRYQFLYTGLSFNAPEAVRFRTRLEGLDPDWVEVGRDRTASYSKLRPSRYVFRVKACNRDGVWNEEGASVVFTVLPHVWETAWFIGLSLGLFTAAVAGTVRYLARRRARRRIELLERQHVLDRERMRIAQDLHDHIGASVTHIGMLSQSACVRFGDRPEAGAALEHIYGKTSELTRTMEEVVWAITPKHDTLESLVNFLGSYAQDFASASGLRCRLGLPPDVAERPVSSQVRHNVFLAFKEALHNVVRHAAATEVRVSINLQADGFTVVVEDDGQGFREATSESTAEAAGLPASRRVSGQGLANIRRRLVEVGGRCQIESEHKQGTRVRLFIPFSTNAELDTKRGPC
jgi:ligand-binding sensor domain-containing protein/signal transduction histidine kinase